MRGFIPSVMKEMSCNKIMERLGFTVYGPDYGEIRVDCVWLLECGWRDEDKGLFRKITYFSSL